MRIKLLTLFSLAALVTLVACGGSSSSSRTPIPPAPSSGNNAGFSTASLNGTYVFAAHGTGPNNFFAVTGTFVADGNGGITSGTRDTVTDAGAQALNESITGTYSVNQDGRGQAVLNGSSGQVIYRFVLRNDGQASLFQISNTSDATGRIIPVPTPLPPVLPVPTNYVVRLDGEDSGLNIFGAVGLVTFNPTNNTLSGQIDQNDNGTFQAQLPVVGSFNLSGSRGTAQVTVNGFTHNFVVYPIAGSRLELLSTDRNFFLHGYAYVQQAPATTVALFKGDQVLNISGADSNGTILETARLTLDGNGGLVNSIEDYNDAGTFFDSITFSGTYAVANTGRWTSTFTYTNSTMSLVGWQVSPTLSLVLVTGTNTANFRIVETGVMRAQTVGLTIASINGNYAEELSGILLGSGPVESAGNFDANGGGNLIGTIDSQTPTSINTDVAQTGNYSVAPNGRSSGTIGAVPVRLYVLDSNTVYLISTDPNRLYQGTMHKQ